MGFNPLAHGGIHGGWSPLTWLYAQVPEHWFLPLGSLIAAALLMLAMLGAFAALRRLDFAFLPSFAGAICYGCSTLLTVRLAQGEGFSYNLIVLPWLFFVIAGATERKPMVTMLLLGSGLFLLFNYSFLQETAYLWAGVALFALIESWTRRNPRPLAYLIIATVCAGIAAVPRIWQVQHELSLLQRTPHGLVNESTSFEVTYAQQNLTSREIARFFSDEIFGRFPAEAADLGNNINLNEGFQVYSSTFASMVILTALTLIFLQRDHADPSQALLRRRRLRYAAVMTVGVSVAVLTKPGLHLLYLLFLGIDFSHGRLVLAALFPLAILLAFGLEYCLSPVDRRGPVQIFFATLAVALAVGTVGSLNALKNRSYDPKKLEVNFSLPAQIVTLLTDNDSPLEPLEGGVAHHLQPTVIGLKWNSAPGTEVEIEMQRDDGPFAIMGRVSGSRYVIGDIDPAAKYAFRLKAWRDSESSDYSNVFVASAYQAGDGNAGWDAPNWAPTGVAIYLCAAVLLFCLWAAALLVLRRHASIKNWLVLFMAALIVTEALEGMTFRLNGPHTRTFPKPFFRDNLFNSPAGTLNPPSVDARRILHARLERDQYRTILLEPTEQFYSATLHVPMTWDLRTPQGGWSGVPRRLAALPWPPEIVSMRRLIFRPDDELPWELLAKLNVKYALTVNTDLYFNRWPDRPTPTDLAGLHIVENPLPVVPREFFAARTVPAEVFSAVQKFPVALPVDPTKESNVEGLPAPRDWSVEGHVQARYLGDRITLTLDPCPRARFLVLNELYHPDWTATTADGKPLKIYAVNTVMRGLEIPSGVTEVRMEFRPPLGGGWWAVAVALGGGGLLLTSWVASRTSWTRTFFLKSVRPLLERVEVTRVAKWFLIGVLFMGLNLPILYLLVDRWHLCLPFATLLAALIVTSLRFFANDRFVFQQSTPTLARLKNYYAANALGFAIWYGVSNLLPHLGVHYLVAAILGTVCSVGVNLTTNFFWVWRKPEVSPQPTPVPASSVQSRASRPWLIVLGVYVILYGSLLLATDGYPYVFDNNESYSSLWHARSLHENGIAKTKGLTDEVFSPAPAASPYIHSHQGNFPRLFTFVFYSLGLHSIGPQIWVATFTVGLAALWLAFRFFARLANPAFAALTCLLLMTDYLFFMQWQVGLYNIWHGFFFFSSLTCIQALGTTERRGRWFLLTVLNFAALFYWEYVFTAFVVAFCGLYALVLHWRRPRLVALAAGAVSAGAVLAAGTLLLQLTAYMGWTNVLEDVHLTLTARNAAADPVLLDRVISFYREHRIIFWHNFLEAAPLRTLRALWDSLFEFHLKYYSPVLLYAAAVLGAGWLLGCWGWAHRGWRRVLPLLALAGLVVWLWPWVTEAQDPALQAQYALTAGVDTLLTGERGLLVLVIVVALACAVAGNATVLGHATGGAVGLLPLLLCGAAAYGLTYRVFTGYIYSGYLHRFVPLPVFLTVPVLGLAFHTLFQASRRTWNFARVTAGGLWRRVPFVLVLTAFAGTAAYWIMLQTTYARIAPPDSYAFLKQLDRPPFKGRSLVSNTYPAPMAARTGSWGYADPSFLSGRLTLTPDGFEPERDLKYLWFADRDTNPSYLKPELAITLIQRPNLAVAMQLARERAAAAPGTLPLAESPGLVQRSRPLHRPFLRDQLAYSDGKYVSIVRLDWDYPPFLRPDSARFLPGVDRLTLHEKLALSEAAQDLRHRWRITLAPTPTAPGSPSVLALREASIDGRPLFRPGELSIAGWQPSPEPGAGPGAMTWRASPVTTSPLATVVEGGILRLNFLRSPAAGKIQVEVNDIADVLDLAAPTPGEERFTLTAGNPQGRYTYIPSFAPGLCLQTILPASDQPRVAELHYHYAQQDGLAETSSIVRLYHETDPGHWELADVITFVGAAGLPVRLTEFQRTNQDAVAEYERITTAGDPRTFVQWLTDHLSAHPEEWSRHGIVQEAMPPPSLPGGAPTVRRHMPLPSGGGRWQFSLSPGTRTKTGPEYFGLPFSMADNKAGPVEFHPPSLAAQKPLTFGRLKLRIRFPANRWPQSEPLVTTGEPEAGDFIYVHYPDPTHIRIGFDHWFKGGPLSPPIAIDFTHEHELEVSLGSLFPAREDVVFANVSAAGVDSVKNRVQVILDGHPVIDAAGECYETGPGGVTVGRNAIFGTLCGPEFTGEILSIERSWPDIK